MSKEHREDIEISSDEKKIQLMYIDNIKKINKKYFEQTGKEKTYMTVTYGCQMNAHDSEKIDGMLIEMGYKKVLTESEADVLVYNTCCVRENAENKIFGNLGYLKKLKEKNKNLKIVLCGCMMQQEAIIDKIKQSYNHVDIIFGTYNLYKFPQLLFTSFETNEMIIDIWKKAQEIIEDLPSQRMYKFKASVNIMFGCNNFCTYCIVPYVRGRERSREVEDIIKEIEYLVEDGVKEITLLGQNVNSYGKNLKEPVTFAELLEKVSKVEGLERIRFMTSHPKDLSEDLIKVIKENDNICKHIHLPVQSGSNKLLKKMNRVYTREDYLKLVEKIKNEIPDISLTTDIIVGFPTETDEDNDETIDLVKEVKYSSAFTFIYSVRSGTPAANMDGQVEEADAKRRFNKLLEVLNPIVLEINKKQIGTKQRILVENISKNDETLVTGRSDNNSLVHFKGDKSLIGTFVDVKITDCKTFYLIGEQI